MEDLKKEQSYRMEKFLIEIYSLENKCWVKPSYEILKIMFQETHHRIIEELVNHRNVPVSEEKLIGLRKIAELPRSLKIILESIKP